MPVWAHAGLRSHQGDPGSDVASNRGRDNRVLGRGEKWRSAFRGDRHSCMGGSCNSCGLH